MIFTVSGRKHLEVHLLSLEFRVTDKKCQIFLLKAGKFGNCSTHSFPTICRISVTSNDLKTLLSQFKNHISCFSSLLLSCLAYKHVLLYGSLAT